MPSRTPLLSSAQAPGLSSRLSDSSLTSLDPNNRRAQQQQHQLQQRTASSSSSMASSARMGPSSTASSTARFGPTAVLGGGQSRVLQQSSNPKAGFIPVDGYNNDDDDLDDHLHTFTAAEKKDLSSPFDITSWRGWANALTLLVLLMAVLGLFALYPIISFYTNDGSASGRNTPGYNLGGINSTGQIPSIQGLPQLVDPDTPEDVFFKTGFDGEEWKLVFSDEFNVEGRTFYDGGECIAAR